MKKIIPLLLSVCLVFGCLSISASAETYENGMPSASTDVYYEVNNQYAVNIPGSVNISEGEVMFIFPEYLFIDDAHQVEIKIDSSCFGDNGRFDLISAESGKDMDCEIYKITSENSEMELITDYTEEPIAAFTNEMMHSSVTLSFVPDIRSATGTGAYQGRLLFNITLAERSAG